YGTNAPRLVAAKTATCKSDDMWSFQNEVVFPSSNTKSRDPGGIGFSAASYSSMTACAGCHCEITEATRTTRHAASNEDTALIRAGDVFPQWRLASAKNATPEGMR